VSFAAPLVLIAFALVPLLVWWYVAEQRRRERGAEAFASAQLRDSVAPERPYWRRHAPLVVMLLALALLIVAAARPRRSVAVPVTDGAVMLVNDISSSMQSTDVKPSRLGAAIEADRAFLAHLPSSVRAGLLTFNQQPAVRQSPTTNRAAVRNALTGLKADGHTAIGDAINLATRVLTGLRGPGGKRIPGAIVLLSDGTSDVGSDPRAAARNARKSHIPIYTVALGTPNGTITVKHGRRNNTVPVPLSGTQLGQIASDAGGKAFTVANAGKLATIYASLATQIGHKHVKHEITASLAGGGLLLLLAGSSLSLLWFGRLL